MAPLVLKTTAGVDIPLISQSPLWGISRAEQKVDLLTGDTLSLTIDSTSPITIQIGQTSPVFEQLYTLNTLPTVRKTGKNRYQYEATLEGPQYHLLRVAFFDVDVDGNGLSSTFSLTGNLAFFAQVLFTNMVRVFSGAWGLGTVLALDLDNNIIAGSATVTKTLTFDSENCLSVLQRLCDEFSTEFSITYRPDDAPNRILNIGPVGTVLSDTFSYGQGNGLYELSRRSVQQGGFYTRAYIFGGSKNLPSGYRGFATRLQLPLASGIPPTSYSPWDSYVQDTGAVTTYGLIEATKVFEDIYPSFEGVVQDLAATRFTFTDPDIGFNPFALSGSEVINGNLRPIFKYIIPGITPKVSFLTGQLAGYTFDLQNFHTNNFILQIGAYTDEQGLEFPGVSDSSPFRIQIGDRYTLVDILMPDSYVEAAEAKLLAAGTAWLAENSTPNVEYELTIDELYLQKKANDTGPIALVSPPNFFTPGDTIRVVDTELGIDKLARITSITRDVLRVYKYTLTLGDMRRISQLQKVLSDRAKVKTLIQIGGLNDPTQAPAVANPAETPTKAQTRKELMDQIRIVSGGVKYTLTGTPLPAGFIPLEHGGNPVRHELQVEVWTAPIADIHADLLGRIRAIARKIPIPV